MELGHGLLKGCNLLLLEVDLLLVSCLQLLHLVGMSRCHLVQRVLDLYKLLFQLLVLLF